MTIESELKVILITMEEIKASLVSMLDENIDIKDEPQIKELARVHEHVNGAILRLYKAVGDKR
jgi:hypothetical protein